VIGEKATAFLRCEMTRVALSGQTNRVRICPLLRAGSTDRHNTGVKSLCWGFES
jgi:hypothetical protein